MENNIQQEIYKWFNNNYCLKHHNPRSIIFSVPNGGYRNSREAMTLKATGLLAGVSDLIIIHNGEVIFVEVKQPKKTQQPNQIEFENRVKSHNFKYFVVTSLEDFKCILH
jgi:hypothetical protein